MKQLFSSLYKASIRNILAIIIIVGSFGLQVMILVRVIPPQNHDIVITTVVLTLGLQGMVASYYFGASKGISPNATTNNTGEKPNG